MGRWEVGKEWVVSFLCLCRSELSSVYGTFRFSLTARFPADSPHSTLLSFVSDYVIDDKVAILQKRDHEGFGFVLRGAKGNGCGFWGYYLRPFPLLKPHPYYGCMSWFGMYWGTFSF